LGPTGNRCSNQNGKGNLAAFNDPSRLTAPLGQQLFGFFAARKFREFEMGLGAHDFGFRNGNKKKVEGQEVSSYL
jgi:hypothetical protein